jgi:hypothetical protein
MKPIHLLATLALLAGCTMPAQTPTAGTVPVAGVAAVNGLVDLPVSLHLQRLTRKYSLKAPNPGNPVASDVVATATYDPTDIGKLIRAVTVQVITDGEPQSGVLTVPSQASSALYPYATAGSGYSRWEIFRFNTGIDSTNPPSIVIKGLKIGKVHRAIVRAYGDGEVPATVYDPSADPAATSAVRLSDDYESTTEIDLTGSTLPTKAKLNLSLYPTEATLGLWYADPDTGAYGQALADVTGGEWISADGLATVTVSPPSTEVVAIDPVGTTTLSAGASDPAVAGVLSTLNTEITNCLTAGGSALGTALLDERLPGGDKVLSIEIPLADAGSYDCNTLPAYRFVERNSVLRTQGAPDWDTKRGYILLEQSAQTAYQVNLKNGVIKAYIKYQ